MAKKATVKPAICLVMFLAALAPGGCSDGAGRPQVTINGRSWQVELATTPEQRVRGLAGRREIGPDAGMLFVFPGARSRVFWMRGCLIDLDVAFIGSDLRVVAIQTMAADDGRNPPAIYRCVRPAQYILEVRAGALAAAGVRVGHKVEFSGDVPISAKAAPDP